MTDEQIIKALECCGNQMFSCTDKQCKAKVMGNALDLINRQKAKIEALQMDNSQLQADNFNAIENAEHLSAEVEIWKEIAHRETNYIDIAKSEAIKEFAERLKSRTQKQWSEYRRIMDGNHIPSMPSWEFWHGKVIEAEQTLNRIGNLVKEMTEGE